MKFYLNAYRLYELLYLLLNAAFVVIGTLIAKYDSNNYFMGLFIMLVFGLPSIITVYRLIKPNLLVLSSRGLLNKVVLFKRKPKLIGWEYLADVTTTQRNLVTTLNLSLEAPIDGKAEIAIPLVAARQSDIDETVYVIQKAIIFCNTVHETENDRGFSVEQTLQMYNAQRVEKTSAKIWWLWAILVLASIWISQKTGRIGNYLFPTANESISAFIYFLFATPVMLCLWEICYKIIFVLGWHSTPQGRKLAFRRGNINIPNFMKNSSSYIHDRKMISNKARILYFVFLASKILILTFLVGILMLFFIFETMTLLAILILVVGATLIMLFTFNYQKWFVHYFHLKIFQVENGRPHFKSY